MADLGMQHQLLVATPLIAEPTFGHTVILVLAHGDAGALGVVLNRPSETAAADLLPEWGTLAVEPGVLFVGGPVDTNAVIGLGPDGPLDLSAKPDGGTEGPVGVRLFVGSAGWSAGQLESEVAEGAWWVVSAQPEDAFSRNPLGLRRSVLRRQAEPISWFANYPSNPMVN